MFTLSPIIRSLRCVSIQKPLISLSLRSFSDIPDSNEEKGDPEVIDFIKKVYLIHF